MNDTQSGPGRRGLPDRGLRPSWLAALAISFALCGCVTSGQYRMAREGGPRATPLALAASAGPLEISVRAMVPPHGPGSWKFDARWDEYVVQLANRGGVPVSVQSVELVDGHDHAWMAGSDPWELEAPTRTWWERSGRRTFQYIGGAADLSLAIDLATASCSASGFAAISCVGLNEVHLLAIVPAAGLIELSVIAIIDARNKERIEFEFRRRKIPLPLVIAPDGTRGGSLFFPITPEPRRLVVRGRAGEVPVEVALELGGLAGVPRPPP